MSTITSLASSDDGAVSRSTINTNFSNLNTDKVETSVLDTDTSLAANSDAKVATQKAVKAYVDAGGNVNASDTVKGIAEEATSAEVNAGTAVGGTGARLFVNPSALAAYLTSANVLTKVASGATTYDLSTASGAQNIAHGLGVAPRLVRITATYSDSASGATAATTSVAQCVYSNSTQSSTFTHHRSATTADNYTLHGDSFTLYTLISPGRSQGGAVTVTSTNIVITWTKTSTPTGTVYITWEAIA